jgi:hypothetical protein
MTKLSPKATRFIDAAVTDLADNHISAVWKSARPDPGKEISNAVAEAALTALQYLERRLRTDLDRYPIDEDEASDLSNDLGFVCSIERDLERQIRP